MDVRLLTGDGVQRRSPEDLPELLATGDGLVWVDVPNCDGPATRVLSEIFRFHPLAVRDCVQRNRMPKVHVYRDHVFVILHAPERGAAGHVHYLELDQFIGARYLVTVHGPVNPAVDIAAALRETDGVLRRIQAGRLRPRSGLELSYAIVSALARRQEAFVEETSPEVWALEQRVTGGHLGDPETFLEEMFQARHQLVAVRAMAALNGEVYGRLAALHRTPESKPLLDDIVDQFTRVYGLADGQKEYLQGVIEFYRTRTDTKMTIAAERLAVIAVVTLPITALSSVLGMNIIVNDRTDFGAVALLVSVMVVMSATLLTWAKKQGWW